MQLTTFDPFSKIYHTIMKVIYETVTHKDKNYMFIALLQEQIFNLSHELNLIKLL